MHCPRQAIVFLKTQLQGTTTSYFVPIEGPEVLTARLDVLVSELERAEDEYDKLVSDLKEAQAVCP